jgi:hypothetical protein
MLRSMQLGTDYRYDAQMVSTHRCCREGAKVTFDESRVAIARMDGIIA